MINKSVDLIDALKLILSDKKLSTYKMKIINDYIKVTALLNHSVNFFDDDDIKKMLLIFNFFQFHHLTLIHDE